MPPLDWDKERIRKKKSITAWNNDKEYWQLYKEGLKELKNSSKKKRRNPAQNNPIEVHRILRNINNKLNMQFMNPLKVKKNLGKRKKYINLIKSKGWHEKDEFQELINFIPYHVALERDALAAKELKKQRRERNKQRKKERKNVHV